MTQKLVTEDIPSLSQNGSKYGDRRGETITDRVYAAVRRDVLECRWPAGQRLKIRDIAAELGVSPMPVRIALRRLGEEGTLVVEENKSARVPFVSRQSFNEYLEISIQLEGLAIERAASRISRPSILALHREAEEMQREIENGNTAGYARRFNGLLMKIYAEGQSRALIEVIEQVWIKTAPPAREAFEERGVVTRLNAALIAVIEAIAAGDAASAKETLASVLQYACKSVNLFLDMDQDQRLKPKRRRRIKSDAEHK
jgi:DNA-binding GntR family transcriptional regulator